jgi:hypothetical protein
VLFVASLILTAVLIGGGHFPAPFDGADAAADFFRRFPDALRLAALLQFGSAIPLGIFTATAASRLQFHGMKVPGVHITMFGGFAAAICQMIAAMFQSVLAQPGIADDRSTMSAFHWLAFAAGGPGFVVPFGLLLAGIAVTSLFGRLLPRPLVWIGLGLAAIAELSTLSMIIPLAAWLLPIARFGGFAWIIAVGVTMPSRRRVGEGGEKQRGSGLSLS